MTTVLANQWFSAKEHFVEKIPRSFPEKSHIYLYFFFSLLRVEEDLEKILKISSKPKPKVPAKPTLPKKPIITTQKNVSSVPPTKPKEDKIQAMSEVDILQYIQENESISSQDMSLF